MPPATRPPFGVETRSSGFVAGLGRSGPGGAGPGGPVAVPREAVAEGRTAPALSERDRELVGYLAAGESTARIAAALSVSTNTARTRIRRVQHRLAVSERQEVVPAARDRGLI